VQAQHKIGRNNFIKGRISSKWSKLYIQDRQQNLDETRKLPIAEIWVRDIINITWNYVLNTWYSRNNTEHQKDKDDINTVKTRLIAKIEWIHEKIPLVDLKIHKKLSINDLNKSTMSNLYVLEQQLTIILQASNKKKNKEVSNGENSLQLDNG
jgi:hypothetical protein